MSGEDPGGGEVVRLRSQNRKLNEQVKLLVKTEQRLYRSQNEVDRELSRIQLLSDFALQCSSLRSPEDCFPRASILLQAVFDLDHVAVATRHAPDVWYWAHVWPPQESGPTEGGETYAEGAHAIDSLQQVELVWLPQQFSTTALIASLHEERFRSPPEGEGAVAVCMPLRATGGALFAYLIAYKEAAHRRSHFREQLARKHLPFLRLVATHLERAHQSAALTRGLRAQGEDLARANESLSASLVKLERAQQQLVQARKMEAIGRLAGGVAHDFNNLLTVILSHAHLLHGQPHSPSAREDIAQIIEASERASSIVQQLLAFSRKQVQRSEAVCLNQLVTRLSRLLERLIGEHIVLRLRLDTHLGRVFVDPVQLEQIVLNLVVNARDALAGGGEILIVTRAAQPDDLRHLDPGEDPLRFAVVSVIDNGAGMDDQIRHQIFEPFFTTKKVGEGSGLGLSTVYGMVKQNRGHILVDSQVGVGSTFTVFLPLQTEAVVASSPPVPEREEPSRSAAVLLVEDERSIRDVVGRILQDEGHHVMYATHGKEALDVIASRHVDLLITDVVMPQLGGEELARRARQLIPDLLVIFMSGYSASAIGSDQLGPWDRFLGKPFTPALLRTAVRQILLSAAVD